MGEGEEGERLKEKEQEEGSQRSSSQVLLFLVVRTAGSPGGNSVPSTSPSDHGFDGIRLLRLLRPPRQGLTDYTLRVNAYKTQPSALHISPPNLERTPEPELLRILHLGFLCITPSKSLSRILILTLIYIFVIMVQLHMHLSPDFHTQPQSKKDWRQLLMFQRFNVVTALINLIFYPPPTFTSSCIHSHKYSSF